MLVSWILNTIEPTLRSTITYKEIAKDFWDDIKERFSERNGPRIHQLKTELVECKQQGMTIVNYYGKLKVLWEELSNYEAHPVCTCEGCTCNLGTQLDKRREEEKLHQFLMGLDDAAYGTVRSNILSTEPLPTLNRAYAMMIQEERVHNITRGKEQRSEQMAFTVQTSYTSTKARPEARDRSVLCTYCNKSGHKAEACFELIGYPDWWGTRSKGRGQGVHKQAVVGGRGRGSVRANAAAGIAAQEGSVPEVDKGLTGLSAEQWTTLLGLLNAQKDGKDRLNGRWIIDSGASHHTIGTLDLLSNVKDAHPVSIGLPDGHSAMAKQSGTVLLNSNLTLKNVLYVPHLMCNLLSVSQLVADMKCTVLFTDQFCVLQDRISRMLIGAGEECEGLYYFKYLDGLQLGATALNAVQKRQLRFGING